MLPFTRGQFLAVFASNRNAVAGEWFHICGPNLVQRCTRWNPCDFSRPLGVAAGAALPSGIGSSGPAGLVAARGHRGYSRMPQGHAVQTMVVMRAPWCSACAVCALAHAYGAQAERPRSSMRHLRACARVPARTPDAPANRRQEPKVPCQPVGHPPGANLRRDKSLQEFSTTLPVC